MTELHSLQFRYDVPDAGKSYKLHRLRAVVGDTTAGEMVWQSRAQSGKSQGRVEGIFVQPEFQRQGVATAMWHEGHRLAAENQVIPKPQHSPDRTKAGDAWARSVGGRLPRSQG